MHLPKHIPIKAIPGAILLFITFFHYLAVGQNNDFIFKNTKEGLSHSTVNTIVQDGYGFLWIGTVHGLNRYDGVNFKRYQESESDSTFLNDQHITQLLADGKNGIWIGTDGGGLNYYDFHKDRFIRLSSPGYETKTQANILRTRDGTIYAGLDMIGLFIVDEEKKTLIPYNDGKADSEKLLINNFFRLAEDHKGNIIIGDDLGVIMIRKSDNKIIKIRDSHGLPETHSRYVYCSESNRTWIGTNNGLMEMIYHPNDSIEFVSVGDTNIEGYDILNKVVIQSIFERDNILWVGTENAGLFRINLKTDEIFHYLYNPNDAHSINSNTTRSIFEDKNKTIWLGGFTSGIDEIVTTKNKISRTEKNINGNYVWNHKKVKCFIEDHDGTLWVGSDMNGLTKISPDGSFQNYNQKSKDLKLTSDNITSMVMDSESNIWIATWGGGVNIINKERNSIRTLKKENPLNSRISGNDLFDLTNDKEGNIWLGIPGEGIEVHHPKKGKIASFSMESSNRKISNEYISQIQIDDERNLWIGYIRSGIEKVTLNKNLEVIKSELFLNEGLENNGTRIYCLFQDSKKNIWTGTSGQGLVKIDKRGKMKKYNSDNHFSSDVVFAIEEDDNGIIWTSTQKDICTFDPETEKFKNYAVKDNNSNTEFFKASSFKSKDGMLYFGTNNEYFSFYPNELQLNEEKPEVYITDLEISHSKKKIFSKTDSTYIFNNQCIVLDHDENDLRIGFSSISYFNAPRNQFEYMLENYDDNWRNATTERSVTYPNVPPRNYTFKVKGANNDGLWNPDFAYAEIKINHPWYSTYWAYLAYLIAGIIAVLLVRRHTLRNLNLQNQLKLEQLEVEKMLELDILKESFFTNVSHEFRTPLTLIISPLKTLLEKKDISSEEKKLFSTMLKNSEYLQKLINEILDISSIKAGKNTIKAEKYDMGAFIKELGFHFSNHADERFIRFKMITPKHPVELYFERNKMEKIIINLLSNAFKYTQQHGLVSIELEEFENEIKIHVMDDGTGIPSKELNKIFDRFYKLEGKNNSVSTGIGLALTKELVKMHGGDISVTSVKKPLPETVFTITLPKGNSHFKKDNLAEGNQEELKISELAKLEVTKLVESVQLTDKKESKDERPLVLVVEDNDDMRYFITTILKDDFQVIEASNGKIGYEKAVSRIPDLVISDIMMPKMNGYDLTRKLKENPITNHIFIILLSAKASEESSDEGYNLGVDCYLTKPFNPTQLQLRVKNLLNSRTKFKEQILNRQTLQIAPEQVPFSDSDESFIKEVISEIEKNMDNSEYKVENLSADLGLSKSQLYRKMKGLVGKSTKEFIRMIRLKRAAQLLLHKDKRISEITFEVGFNDLQNFRQAFKKETGMTPKEYRDSKMAQVK